MARDGWSIDTLEAKKMALPAWYMEGEPLLDFGTAVYITAFWELCADRQFGYAVGPIPWSSIRLYSRDLGLNRRMHTLFHFVIRELDGEYDRYQKREQGKKIRDREAESKAKKENTKLER